MKRYFNFRPTNPRRLGPQPGGFFFGVLDTMSWWLTRTRSGELSRRPPLLLLLLAVLHFTAAEHVAPWSTSASHDCPCMAALDQPAASTNARPRSFLVVVIGHFRDFGAATASLHKNVVLASAPAQVSLVYSLWHNASSACESEALASTRRLYGADSELLSSPCAGLHEGSNARFINQVTPTQPTPTNPTNPTTNPITNPITNPSGGWCRTPLSTSGSAGTTTTLRSCERAPT
jgi:hypothetical protein